jgi:hypothetical protein
MNVEWTYITPSLCSDVTIHIKASLRHGYIEQITINPPISNPETINLSHLPDLSDTDPFIAFSFYKMLFLKKTTDAHPDGTHLILLKILQDYFVILEIMKQIKNLAVAYDDKALFQTTHLFFTENVFNKKILSRLTSIVVHTENPKAFQTILSLSDVFFLYDLIMGYQKAKEKEGRLYLFINNFLFKHINKDRKILRCDFYRDDFLHQDRFVKVSLPEYRDILLDDLKSVLAALKTDLEQLSKNENGLSLHTFNPGEKKQYEMPVDLFHFGRVILFQDDTVILEYVYDSLFKHKECFTGLSYEALEFILSLLNFQLKEKVFV